LLAKADHTSRRVIEKARENARRAADRYGQMFASDLDSGETEQGVRRFELLLGIFWIVSGAVELFTAPSHRQMPHRGWNAVMGIVSVLAGIVVLVYPGISLLVLAVVLGVWLIVFGAMQITVAFRIRSLAHT
jgi:uncharacterized membrane protein HdeD (DUF308 family)